jgi:hypothetical protein
LEGPGSVFPGTAHDCSILEIRKGECKGVINLTNKDRKINFLFGIPFGGENKTTGNALTSDREAGRKVNNY